MKQIFDSDDDSIFPTVVPPVPAEYFVTPPGVTDAETGQGSAPDVPTARSLVRDDVALPIYSFAVKVLPDRDFFHGGFTALGQGVAEVVAGFRSPGFSRNAWLCVAG